MKKTKLLKLLAIGSLSTIAVTMPLVTTLTSCNEITATGVKEIIASDNMTKITFSNDTYNLIHPFDKKSMNDLKKIVNDQEQTMICCSNYSIRKRWGITKNDEFITSTYGNLIYLLKDDYFGFIKLIKINDKSLLIQELKFIETIDNAYHVLIKNSKEVIDFFIKNLKIDLVKKELVFNLMMEKQTLPDMNDIVMGIYPKIFWTAELGKFTFTNAVDEDYLL